MAQYESVPTTISLSSITTAAAEIAAVEADVDDLQAAEAAAAAAIGDLETAVGTYEGGPSTIALDLAAAEAAVADLETAVGTYGGAEDLSTDVAAALVSIGTPATVSTETDLFAIRGPPWRPGSRFWRANAVPAR
jgi:hypothetical protein